MKICEICGTEFHPNSNNHKYCGDECARIAKREQVYQAVFRYRMKWKIHNKKDLGTSYLGPHRNPDFNIEYEKIQLEKRKQGIL